MAKVKFNGESIFSAFDHIFQFIKKCNDYDIDESVMYGIFTLTLTGQAKYWCLSLPVTSVDSWDDFSRIFLQNFQEYNCDHVCQELEKLHRIEGESYVDFLLRFKLICFKFQSDDLPSQFELIAWFRHILSLSCSDHNEPEGITFLSVFSIVDEPVISYGIVDPIVTFNLETTQELFQEI